MRIGLVVDKAHIGLDSATEFGKFAYWLIPDFLIMATATPRDERLNEFLQLAGKGAFENFPVSRDEVVKARLNKRYIEAVVYDLRQSVQTVADLKRTVLRQAWLRHLRLKTQLQDAGVVLTPLLLVQVGNGDKSVEEAEQILMTLCKVPPGAIGKHSADAPDPVLMAAIANDTSKEVLIFKQSAGTGFDAPRAFVLASVKPVHDPDFAMQFIGRVMRVARAIREAFPRSVEIPPDFDTAYVYLANAQEQSGFEAAVHASSHVKSHLEGQTERLETRQMQSGAVLYTSRVTEQFPVSYGLPEPERNQINEPPPPGFVQSGPQGSLFGDGYLADWVSLSGALLDEPLPSSFRRNQTIPASEAALSELLTLNQVRSYPRKTGIAHLPKAFSREQRPMMDDMSRVSQSVADRLLVSICQNGPRIVQFVAG